MGLVVIGTLGYMSGLMSARPMSWVDALYMTVITLTTVGFGEVEPLTPAGELFTTTLILFGVAFGAWAITTAVEIVLGDTLWLSVQRRKMTEAIEKLRDHYNICGYGRFGIQIVRDLRARGEPFVIIDFDPTLEEQFIEEQLMYLIGDATQDETLRRAGVGRATGLVSALNSDANNLMTVLTAREFNSSLLIVARANVETTESKLRRAGADRAITPDTIGGHRLALALLRPAVHDFMSGIFSFGSDTGVDLGQLQVLPVSPFAGQTIAGCDLRRIRNVSILAVRDIEGGFNFNAAAQRVIQPGETLILIGPAEAIYDLEAMYGAEVSGGT